MMTAAAFWKNMYYEESAALALTQSQKALKQLVLLVVTGDDSV